ncbi:MAG: protein kinase domain-containing protein [Streptosporangiaceae bacterium]
MSGAEDAAVRGRFRYVLGYEPGACGLFRGRQGRVAGGYVRAHLASLYSAWRGSGGHLARGAVMAVTGTGVLAGRYVMLDVLGTGGMAMVWRARDEVLGRDVAVKVLSPQYAADPGFLARFEREARHAARLSHPRLVTVFDSGVDGTSAFIVMELVVGPTLRQVLDQAGPLPEGEAVRIAAAVCEALEVAHAAGLVHRDIKPANIMLTGGGEVKVLDFGIARADGGDGTTGTLGVLGTAAYLSPEQASGQAAGPQSDLYSLGCVLFEMLTGAPPFSAGTTVGLAYRQVHEDPGPPSARRPGLPGRLDQVTGRLLAKNPAGRPASAAAARAALLAALTPDATAVLTPAGDPEPGRPGRWRPRLAEAVLTAALAASLIALAAVLLAGVPGHPRVFSPPGHPAATHAAAVRTTPTPRNAAARTQASALPPAAAAAGAFVGDLQAAVADGQVTPQAGQDLFNHLQQLLFGPPGQNTQQIQQQYQQLIQAYDQHQSQGQITGPAASRLRHALQALGIALGAL